MKRLARILAVVVCLALVSTSLFAAGVAEAEYPAKPIYTIVPWGAGGGTDITIRGFLQVAEKHVGTTFNVTNIPGGVGSIGWAEAASANADGYTIVALTYDLMVHSASADSPVSYKDFIPVVTIAQYPQVLAVKVDDPWSDFEEFVAFSASRPGDVRIALSGLGGIHHQALLTVERQSGVEFRPVPFRGGAECIAALLGGNVEATFTDVPEAAGRPDLRVLVQFAAQRHVDAPDVPTAREFGMDIDFSSFRSLGVPKGTPQHIVDFLREKFDETWHSQEFLTWANNAGVAPSYMSGADTQVMFDSIFPAVQEALKLMDR